MRAQDNVYIFFLGMALMLIISSCAGGNGSFIPPAGSPTLHLTVDTTRPIGTSHFSPGITYPDNTLDFPWQNNDLSAVNNVKKLIEGAIPYQNTHIMAWGAPDPWPDPAQAEPSDWSELDSRLQLVHDTGGVPVITLAEAPWWMKGALQPDGSTRLLTAADEWSDLAYGSRILDNKMADWLHLVQRVAERYMVPPYNVRYFQVWNELKGYYNPITNAYDYTDSPGDPTGPNAKHGYTYMYNQVYQRLMLVAQKLGIAPAEVKVGGPYVVLDTWSSPAQSNRSSITRPYGTYDQRALDVVQYWLQHKAGAGFITLDGGLQNKDGRDITDPFNAAEKFADVVQWIRSLNKSSYPGAATLPIWWAEWYASPPTDVTNQNYINALRTYAMMKLLKAGGAVAFSWGGLGDGSDNSGLWTATEAGGGQPLPWYYSYKAFKDYFPPGTIVYQTTLSSQGGIEALASATKLMLVNKTAQTIIVVIDGITEILSPYQVGILNR